MGGTGRVTVARARRGFGGLRGLGKKNSHIIHTGYCKVSTTLNLR